ncbi:MAG: CZB domain-containing protein [Zoogloea sp.]|uniref:CZB domain-containing protein n=1 Tax=Zoogloea sp. TaxID=49181 RepID=UPI003F2E0209
MQQLMTLSTQMEGVITASSTKSFIEVAKIDHIVFKFRIYQALFGLLELAPGEVANHTACRLGKWYYEGDGHTCFRSNPTFREIESPHAEVHRAGIAALEAHRSHNLTEVLRQLDMMESASERVQQHLQHLGEFAISHSDELCPHHH